MSIPIQKAKDSIQQRQMISVSLEEGLIHLRGLSPKRLRFELEYALERGSTANSFLFLAGIDSNGNEQPPILIHPPGAAFSDVFIPALANALPNNPSELSVVVGHINPNRIALLQTLATLYPNLKLIASNPGAKLLREIWNQKDPRNLEQATPPIPEITLIKQKTKIPVSYERQLILLPAPTARWPGGLLAYEESLGLLMSDKLFGAHICTSTWAESNRSSTEEDRRHYYDCLMAPMADQVDTLVEKIEELEIRTIAPGHGPSIDSSWRSLLNDYRRWGESQKQASLKIVLLFASAYGNTATIADALARGVGKAGIQVESLNCEFTSADKLLSAIKEADAYLIGSPTLGGHAPTPIISALGTLLAEGDRKKKVGIFGSYGWSGEALDLLENKLRDGGFKFGFEPIKIKFSPDTSMLKVLEETGTLFARKLLQAKGNKHRQAARGMTTSRSDPAVVALGKVIGSLCVLTATQGEEEERLNGAMVASWVSQASFYPLGITIAIAKDRAVEALLHCGDKFALNVLAAGKQNKLLRQFLQPFPPGANRFEGVQIEMSPSGQPILPEALAWLEGTVSQRMECGDHWLIYAEVKSGAVLDKEGITAIHHRQTGANY